MKPSITPDPRRNPAKEVARTVACGPGPPVELTTVELNLLKDFWARVLVIGEIMTKKTVNETRQTITTKIMTEEKRKNRSEMN